MTAANTQHCPNLTGLYPDSAHCVRMSPLPVHREGLTPCLKSPVHFPFSTPRSSSLLIWNIKEKINVIFHLCTSVPKHHKASWGISLHPEMILMHSDSLITTVIDCFTAIITECLHVTVSSQSSAGHSVPVFKTQQEVTLIQSK